MQSLQGPYQADEDDARAFVMERLGPRGGLLGAELAAVGGLFGVI